jgi:hypothetical protein
MKLGSINFIYGKCKKVIKLFFMKFTQIIRGQKQLSFLDIHRPGEVVNIIKYHPTGSTPSSLWKYKKRRSRSTHMQNIEVYITRIEKYKNLV